MWDPQGTNEFLFSENTCSPAFSHSQPSWCRLASGGINWIHGELTENCCGCDGDNSTVMRELTSCARLAVTSNRLWRPRELRGFALLDSRHSVWGETPRRELFLVDSINSSSHHQADQRHPVIIKSITTSTTIAIIFKQLITFSFSVFYFSWSSTAMWFGWWSLFHLVA